MHAKTDDIAIVSFQSKLIPSIRTKWGRAEPRVNIPTSIARFVEDEYFDQVIINFIPIG